MNEDSESALTDAKYGFISGAFKETFTDNHLEQEQTTRVLDSIVTHRIWGYPIFLPFYVSDVRGYVCNWGVPDDGYRVACRGDG